MPPHGEIVGCLPRVRGRADDCLELIEAPNILNESRGRDRVQIVIVVMHWRESIPVSWPREEDIYKVGVLLLKPGVRFSPFESFVSSYH